MEVVEHYGDPPSEHAALREAAGVLDLSLRSRLCLTGQRLGVPPLDRRRTPTAFVSDA